MKRIEYHGDRAVKTLWGPGPWLEEPDKIQWPDEATGLPCLIVRNRLGALCGYVGVTEGHPAFGMSYDDPASPYGVHGGLTFADFCQPHADESDGICHLPEPGESDRVYWFGFDCAHALDLVPEMDAMRVRMNFPRLPYAALGMLETYKGISYVEAECASLARQLADMQ